MDMSLLAQTLTDLLAPAMPYLVKGGKDLVAEAGKDLSGGAWERIKRLWGRLRPKVEERPAAQAAAEEVARAPRDDDALAFLCLQLRKILSENPQLAAEVTRLAEEVRHGDTVYAELHGDGAIAQGRDAKAVGASGLLVDGDLKGDVILGGNPNRRERKPEES